ncbi:hypothetical protein [Streptomyces endophyticus]|uniref:Uncharacterized protein n=1 Tax=Streptomyces endophyticus TaxID=714166 RepID=A0ABU6FCH9_9ACTN|nr:hypothetical protein [Streptomyces endophyticus]MEB8341735.1 hypothetical protein [Streptomyces endophyticus]
MSSPDHSGLPDPLDVLQQEYDDRRRAEEKRGERYMWWYLGYFLFGIHIVAFVMIFAIKHAN